MGIPCAGFAGRQACGQKNVKPLEPACCNEHGCRWGCQTRNLPRTPDGVRLPSRPAIPTKPGRPNGLPTLRRPVSRHRSRRACTDPQRTAMGLKLPNSQYFGGLFSLEEENVMSNLIAENQTFTKEVNLKFLLQAG